MGLFMPLPMGTPTAAEFCSTNPDNRSLSGICALQGREQASEFCRQSSQREPYFASQDKQGTSTEVPLILIIPSGWAITFHSAVPLKRSSSLSRLTWVRPRTDDCHAVVGRSLTLTSRVVGGYRYKAGCPLSTRGKRLILAPG